MCDNTNKQTGAPQLRRSSQIGQDSSSCLWPARQEGFIYGRQGQVDDRDIWNAAQRRRRELGIEGDLGIWFVFGFVVAAAQAIHGTTEGDRVAKKILSKNSGQRDSPTGAGRSLRRAS